MNQLLIHIGYPKTATTWAQHNLFNAEACGFGSLLSEKSDRQHFNDLVIGPDAAVPFPTRIDELNDEISRVATNLVPVISAESLVGVGTNWLPRADAKLIAERLKQLFPEARILLTIREQNSWLHSEYTQYIRGGGWKPFSDYLNPVSITKQISARAMWMNYLLYDRTITIYREAFGEKNILVLPLEKLKADAQDFVERIWEFCGIDAGDVEMPSFAPIKERQSGLYVTLRRPLNRFISSDPNHPLEFFVPSRAYGLYARGFKWLDGKVMNRNSKRADAKLNSEISDLVGGYYAKSNQRTAEMTGLDLASLGYML